MSLRNMQIADNPKLALFVQSAFKGKMPSLIPFVHGNSTIVKLAQHLKRHTGGSPKTLYQYVFGISRFSRWAGVRQPSCHLMAHDAMAVP